MTEQSKYLAPDASEREILSHLDPATRAEYEGFGHRAIITAFLDRVFVVYKPSGRNNQGVQRAPKILTTMRVISFVARDDMGCIVRLLDETTNKTLEVGHVPTRLFDYPIFLHVPTAFTLKWDVHMHGGRAERTLNYTLLMKTRNRATFMSTSNTYMATPNELRDELYPHLDLQLDL